MMMELYVMTLLTLCLVVLVLALVVLMQNVRTPLTSHGQSANLAKDTSFVCGRPELYRMAPPMASRWTEPVTHKAQALMITGNRQLTEAEQLSLVVSAFGAVKLQGSNASTLIAERTLPRLKDKTAGVRERLHMGRHRLKLIELGDDLKAANIAHQVLSQLPNFEATA